MDEQHPMTHATPLVNRNLQLDDSGYLTNTPESSDSCRTSTSDRLTLSSLRRSSIEPRYKLQQVSPLNNGMLYTPELSTIKPIRRFSLALKPFPISTEESQSIEPMFNCRFPDMDMFDVQEEPEEMCTDSEDCGQDNNTYLPDPLDTSLYETVQNKKSCYGEEQTEILKHTGMEIDDDASQLSHPNSENEDWVEIENSHGDLLSERISQRKRLSSLETRDNQELLLQKLEVLQTESMELMCIKRSTWRDHLKNGGCRYANDFSGKGTVDFMLHLGVNSNHIPVISRILDCLSPVDLQSCTSVSKAWRDICTQDRKSMVRLSQYTRQLAISKENNVKHSFLTQSHRNGPLTTISNFQNVRRSPPSSPKKSPLKARMLEMSELERSGIVVMVCPVCKGPAKVDKLFLEAECNKIDCRYNFCTTCRLQSHRPKPCQFATGRKAPKRSVICSKESKKNLRRLVQF